MNGEQAKQEARNRLPEYLDMITEKKGRQYICPICGSGKGKNKTPAGQLNEDLTYHCYSCGFHGDIFNLVGKVENITDAAEKFNRVYEIFNLFTEKKQTKTKSAVDYTEYYKSCHARAGETEYFSFRGLTKKTLDKFMLGYDSEWQSPKALREGKKPPTSSRIIIPTGRYSYIARATDQNADPKFKAVKEGASEIFNKKALQSGEPVFIVEGEIDALSIFEVGGQSLALGGLGNKKKFVELLADAPPTAPVILSLDNDAAGRKVQSELKAALENINISVLEINISGEHKDPNEYLMKNKNLFLQTVKDVKASAVQYSSEVAEIKKAEVETAQKKYINETAVTGQMKEFLGKVKASADTPAIATNFDELDAALDEGLYEGLYILGAISSLGKTSFALQIADQIAQQGQDVLIVSLEMARTELMAKSISRITFLECGDNTAHAKTTRGITAGKRYEKYTKAEKELISESIQKYSEYTDHLFIYEGIGDIGVAQVRELAETHIKATGNKPVVIIDYLQILAPFEMRGSDKQNTDKAVFELKRLSRDFKIPIIGISSLNRESYNATISMSAFKESGAIEYSSDVLLGMQFETTELNAENINRMKREEVRKIELKILKNRNGATGDSITYDYYPMFNYFKETGKKMFGSVTKKENGKRL